MNHNPLQKSIYEKVVMPALSQISHDVEGTIVGIDYYRQMVTLCYPDNQGVQRTMGGVNLPKDGDGIFRESVQVGDRARIAFKDGSSLQPYITMIYKNTSQRDYFSKKGASIPKGIGYI